MEEEEVQAVPIETGIEELAKSDQYLAALSVRAAKLAEEYRPHEIVSAADYKESKVARTAARKEIAALTEERKSLTREIDETVKRFKHGAAKAMEPLSSIDAGYKARLDEWDAARLEDKKRYVHEAYTEFAPELEEMVPFDRLWKELAPKGKWDAKSTNVVTCADGMREFCQKMADGFEVIDRLAADDAERQSLKTAYLETFDLNAAIRQHEEHERLASLVSEHDSRVSGMRTPEPEQDHEPQPQPEPHAQALQEEPGAQEAVWLWTVRVPETVQKQFVEAMRQLPGVHGERVEKEQ